ERLGQAGEVSVHSRGDVARGLGPEGGDQAHGEGPEDYRVHYVKEARARAAGPRVGRLRLGDDRAEPSLNRLHFLAAFELDQLELGLLARGLVGNDLVDDRGDRADETVEEGHGRLGWLSGCEYMNRYGSCRKVVFSLPVKP